MNEPLTSRMIVDELLRLSRLLDQAHDELVVATNQAAKAEAVYRVARANAFLSTSGTVGEREARTEKTVATERQQAHETEGRKVNALERVRSIRAQLSAGQTMATALKAELDLAGRYD